MICTCGVLREPTRTREIKERDLPETRLQSNTQRLENYTELKANLVRKIGISGALFALYFASTLSLKAGLASGIGSIGGYFYFSRLISEVDSIESPQQIPIKRLDQMDDGVIKTVLSWIAHYQQALSPRMIIVVLLALVARYSDLVFDEGFTLLEQGCMLAGFISYKIPLILVAWDELKPTFEPISSKRPRMAEDLEDDSDLFDIYGRRKPSVDENIKNVIE